MSNWWFYYLGKVLNGCRKQSSTYPDLEPIFMFVLFGGASAAHHVASLINMVSSPLEMKRRWFVIPLCLGIGGFSWMQHYSWKALSGIKPKETRLKKTKLWANFENKMNLLFLVFLSASCHGVKILTPELLNYKSQIDARYAECVNSIREKRPGKYPESAQAFSTQNVTDFESATTRSVPQKWTKITDVMIENYISPDLPWYKLKWDLKDFTESTCNNVNVKLDFELEQAIFLIHQTPPTFQIVNGELVPKDLTCKSLNAIALFLGPAKRMADACKERLDRINELFF